MDITPAQCRAARGLLSWSQVELAKAARVGLSSVRNFEAERTGLIASNARSIQHALEAAGVEFLPGGGVRLRTTEG